MRPPIDPDRVEGLFLHLRVPGFSSLAAHWMLEEVVSWFKPEEKSRGVIEDVRTDGGRAQLDDALHQFQTGAEPLFGGARRSRQLGLTWPPSHSSLGRPMPFPSSLRGPR